MAILCLLLTGCGTLLHSPTESVAVESRPAGANATIRCDGGVTASGVTPASLLIPRRADGCTLLVERAGFHPQTLAIERGFSGAYWLNFVTVSVVPFAILVSEPSDATLPAAWGGSLLAASGFLIDHFRGTKYSHDPAAVTVELEPVNR